MGFFSRNKEDESKSKSIIPSLPNTGLPELPQIPEDMQKENVQPLPKLPGDKLDDTNGMHAIKSNLGFKPKYTEFEDKPEEKRTFEIQDPTEYSKKPIIEQTPQISKEPIFIKLEKFRDAVEKFEEIKNKIKFIEESMTDIKVLKEKEDQELKSWEQEVQIIKEKVANIDGSLFSKI